MRLSLRKPHTRALVRAAQYEIRVRSG
jgi:hypothetical protein